MKNILFLIIFIGLSFTMKAQQVNPCGGHTVKDDFSAEWIIGGSLTDVSMLSAADNQNVVIYETPGISLIDVNPTITRDFLTMAANDLSLTRLNYKITNPLGVSFLEGNFNLDPGFMLDVQKLPAGCYLILFSSPDNQSLFEVKKFIKI